MSARFWTNFHPFRGRWLGQQIVPAAELQLIKLAHFARAFRIVWGKLNFVPSEITN